MNNMKPEPRTCTEVILDSSKDQIEPKPVKEFIDSDAYVLLGAPGSGKTEEFERQAEFSDNGHYVTARNFRTLKAKPEWRDKTLFIDGLDEVRAGTSDRLTPFDEIRAKLEELGKPKFRLSCREADWFGSNDHRHLQAVARDGKVRVLRLDPLSESNIRNILATSPDVADPDTFMAEASQRGVAELLSNPLSLKLLVKAIQNEQWPESRKQTFEMACKTLVREENDQHYDAVGELAPTGCLMQTAGQICAVLLLAGAAGIRTRGASQNGDNIALDELGFVGRSKLFQALSTRIFEEPDSGIATPIHRQIAEFLGARYLAKLVDNGLPVGRILALMSGYDGMIVTELRGLCAWLATLSLTARNEIIARDPLGTVLYGDLTIFSNESKSQILWNLNNLAKENFWFILTIKLDSRLGDIVSNELEGIISNFLNDPDREDRRQSLVNFLVSTLEHAQPLEHVAPKLMEIIRDDSRWPRIRQKAIKAYVQQCDDEEQALQDLKRLMQDVYLGKVSDPDDDLLGRLLEETYPKVLPGTEVLNYLRLPRINQYLSNEVFWTLILPRKSDCTQIAKLLDELAVRYEYNELETRQTTGRNRLSTEVPLILLGRFLADCKSAADAIEPLRLFNWLGAASRAGDWNYDISYSYKERERVRFWLNERPELWKTLLKIGLDRCKDLCEDEETSDYQQFMWMEEDRRLFGAYRPIEFADWLLDQAIVSDDLNAAKWLMRRVSDAIEEEKISRKTVELRIEGRNFLKEALIERIQERQKHKEWAKRLDKEEQQYEQEDQKEEKKELSQWQIMVRDNRDELINNRAPAQLLHKLAIGYFGGYHSMTPYSPIGRLNFLLGNDEELVDSALTGLRGVVTRDELPSLDDVIRIGAEHHIQYLWFPFLAGYNELSKSVLHDSAFPNEDQIQLAVTLYFNVNFWSNPWGIGEAELEPKWFRALLQDEPKTVAEALIKTVTARLRSGMDVSNRLYNLAYSDNYTKIAEVSVIQLLKSYPVRCKAQQVPGLRFLLIAAHRHCNSSTFKKLIVNKLAHRSMNVVQRVYWLAAGFLAVPHRFRKRLRDYVAGNVKRVTYLSQFIAGRFEYSTKESEQIDTIALSSLIKLLGTVYPPYSSDSDSDSEEGGIVTNEMDASFRINEFITQLGRDSSDDASQELMMLAGDDDLKTWHTQLKYAINHQKSIRREAEFKHASLPAILDVLNNKQPANVADLAALTTDHLIEIASNIQDGNTSDWRQYWNVDSYNRAQQPKPENACRDNLLSDLRQRLVPLDVDAQSEGSYADDKQADIRVSFGGFNVPIETKRSCHRDLWTAIRTQLIAKYTRDPEADGNGIYLVFWFGNHEKCRPTPDAASPPKSAEELKRRLEESLTDAERRKISVCVIDVEDRKNQVELDSISHE